MASQTTTSNSVPNLERTRESRRGRKKKMESSAPCRGRAVREAADRALAVAAKGRTRWSCSILTNRKLKFMKSRRPRGEATPTASRPSVRKTRLGILRLKAKNLPTVQRKVRVLSRLVPGCRKEALPVILEEATNYIPALEMQVYIMTNLTDLFTRSSSGAGSSSSVPAAAVHSP